jgi:predicted GH43/DUF377 family glycosyl hydrolase
MNLRTRKGLLAIGLLLLLGGLIPVALRSRPGVRSESLSVPDSLESAPSGTQAGVAPVLLPGKGVKASVPVTGAVARKADPSGEGQAREAVRRIAPPITAAPDGKPGEYVLRDRNVSAFFTGKGVALALARPKASPSRHGVPVEPEAPSPTPGWGLHWGMEGAREVAPRPEGDLPGKVNYFVGDKSKWKSEQPTYSKMVYAGVKPGVDMIVEARPHGYEYRLEVAAGAKVDSLRFRYEGAKEVRVVDNGSALEIVTGVGILKEGELKCWQEGPGGRTPVEAHYVVRGGAGYEIAVGPRDPKLPLVIDPTISWSSFLGGNAGTGEDVGCQIALDGSGDVIVAGETHSPNFPSSTGCDPEYNGAKDIFVCKIDAAGTGVLWSTFLGGTSDESAYGMALDTGNNIYLAGYTNSTDFPTPGGFDTSFNGGTYDVIVAKISADGSTLVWGSYLGGSGSEQAQKIAVDGSGNAYVTGNTASADFPTDNGYDTTYGGGSDGFVTKISATGASVVWSTYLGGSGMDGTGPIAVDASGNVYTSGITQSSDFPVLGGFDLTYSGGADDGFVTKISASGASLVWSTFIGGSAGENVTGLAIDGSGNVFIGGYTQSSGFPVTGGAYDTSHNGGSDAFVAKVDASGTALTWCTFVGGSGYDDIAGSGLAIDGAGNVYFCGTTESSDFPTSGYDTTYGGARDGFVAKLAAGGASLLWATYLGGSGEDSAYQVAVDGSGNAYVTGYTDSSDYPTATPFDPTRGGTRDAFVTKVDASGSSLAWSSYLGGDAGAGYEAGSDIVVDGSGNLYITGYSTSADFPTLGAYDAATNGGEDAYVTKLNGAGATIVWSTYLGGTSSDRGQAIVVDGAGCAHVTGQTQSTDFPTPNGFDTVHNGGRDVFLTKLSSDGSSLVWSSYLGGSGDETPVHIILNAGGDAFLTGSTNSTDFPTPGGYDTTYNGGVWDAFVAKVSAAGPSLAWATYLGGSLQDAGAGVVLDSLGNVCVGILSQSPEFPMVGGFDTSHNGGDDVVLVKLNPTGSSILWSTFLGGPGNEITRGIAIDGNGDFYVVGYTDASGFPLVNAFDSTFAGSHEGFMSKVSADGSSLIWSSYFGGSGAQDIVSDVCITPGGALVITGYTASTDLSTPGGFDTTYGGGPYDAFVARINPSGPGLMWCSYLGGAGEESEPQIAADGSGNLYVAGYTNSSDFPSTGGFDTTLGLPGDAFVTKITMDVTPPVAGSVAEGSGADLDVQVSTTSISASWSGFSDPESGISGYEWAIGTTPGGTNVQGWTSVGVSTSATNSSLALIPGTRYYVTVRATNSEGLTVISTADGVLVTGGWQTVSSMSTTRAVHPMTLLTNGKVLAAGGHDGNGTPRSTCELFDPATGAWSATGSLTSARSTHTATLLPNGKVLVAGGMDLSTVFTSCELYDPSTGLWSAVSPMLTARQGHTATLLRDGKVLVAGGASDLGSTTTVAACELYDPGTNAWSPAGSLTTARYCHRVALLPDGDVLVSGGASTNSGPILSGCERYDFGTGTWGSTGSLNEVRATHSLTLLPSGLVLAASGQNSSSTIATCELYDPGAGTWSYTGSVSSGRFWHSSNLLPNGQVLVTGGDSTVGAGGGGLTSCELYDSVSGIWAGVGGMTDSRYGHGSILLPTGNVLVAGGTPDGTTGRASCELFITAAGSWTAANPLPEARGQHQSVVLADGRVLVAGGTNSSGTPIATARLYDPATGTWSNAASMAQSRYGHMLILLADGRAMAIGGTNAVGADLTACEIYDPAGNTWTATGSMTTARRWSEGVRLKDGRVLVAGSGYGFSVTGLCEIYDPAAGTWSATGSLNEGRNNYTLTLLHDGRVLAVGGAASGASSKSSCEIFDPGTGLWSMTNPLPNEARREHTATLLPDGRVLVAGGFQEPPNVRLATCALYNPSSGTWVTTGSLYEARMHHSAVLLPCGKVLIPGGNDIAGAITAGCEVYDPAAGMWTRTASLAGRRSLHSALLLVDGRVLAAGGHDGTSYLASCEIYENTGADPGWRPVIATVNGSSSFPLVAAPASTLALAGARFRGISEVSGGGTSSSATDFPLIRLESLSGSSGQSGGCGQGNGRTWTLPATGWADGTNSSVTLPSAAQLPTGYYLLSVIVNGIPGEARALKVVPDATPPLSGAVSDGAAADIDFQGSTTTISGNWSGFSDPESGITGYEWAIGTTPGGTDVQGWTNVGLDTSATNSSLSLASGTTYYVAVRVTNGSGLTATAASNGVMVDTSVPVAGAVNDGPDADVDFQVSTTMITANWFGFSDPESGISGYEWAIGTTPGGTDIQGWTSVGLATSATNSSLSLTAGQTCYVTVRATNGAGLTATASSDRITVNNPTWSATGTLLSNRAGHQLVLLPTGKILALGGNSDGSHTPKADCELYDPSSGIWSATGSLSSPRSGMAATVLPNGLILASGGGEGAAIVNTCQLYDPSTGTWSAAAPMATARGGHTATLLRNGKVLVAGGVADLAGTTMVAPCELYDPATDTWSPAGSLTTARSMHTAALLPDGDVLVSGGGTSGGAITASCERYDSETGLWGTTGALSGARSGHTLTLLPSGLVLAASGQNPGSTVVACELYDPGSGTWSLTGSVATGRLYHSASLLPNGQILIAGGDTTVGLTGGGTTSCEIYDPPNGTWSSTASLAAARYGHGSVILPGGQVLVAGGSPEGTTGLSSCEVYNPALGSWAATGSLSAGKSQMSGTLLPDGTVIAAGGVIAGGAVVATCERYNPATGLWTSTGALGEARADQAALLLPSGKVLISGGINAGGGSMTTCELYDPATGIWSPTGSMTWSRQYTPMVLLPNGRVLAAGSGVGGSVTANCEIYDPSTGTWSATGSMASERNNYGAILLKDGRVLVTGGAVSGAGNISNCEIYDPSAGTWTATGSMISARREHGTVLLPDGRVLVAGGFNGSFLSTCEIFDPSSGTWSATGSMAGARMHVVSILLPDGRVLTAGGYDGSGPIDTCEIFDPATGTWSAGPILSSKRGHQLGVMLPSGKVLAIGGETSGAVRLATCEVFDPAGALDAWKPSIATINGSSSFPLTVAPGGTLSVTGARFRGISAGGGGHRMSGPADFPLVRLIRMPGSSLHGPLNQGGGQQWTLPATGWADGMALSAPLPPPAETPGGYYLLSVIVNGIPSEARTLRIADTTPPAAPTVLLTDQSSGSPAATDSPTVDIAIGNWTTWTRHPGNPILTSSMPYDTNDNHQPHVLRAGGTYMMYYTCSSGGGFRTALATSTDGIAWTKHPSNPVLVGSGYDGYAAMDASVILDGATFKMWYTGYDASMGTSVIAYATSADGVSWTRVGVVLNKGGGGEWDSSYISDPAVIKDGATYRMWYMGSNDGGSTYRFGYATSPDGTTWTKHPANPVFAMSPSGWDSTRVLYPMVHKVGTCYRLYYVGDNAGTYGLGEAESSDGVAWTRNPNPVLTTVPATWESLCLQTGSVILEGGTLRMWYEGMDGGTPDGAFGYAASTDGGVVGWWVGESQPTAPPLSDAGWTATKPTSFTLSGGTGVKTVYVWCRDEAGNVSGSSDTIIVDTTGPVAGAVNDGGGADIAYQASTTTISANWSGFGDPQSGVVSYEWAIGTTPGGTDIQGWANVGLSTSATNGSLTLVNGTTYYVSVRATNGAGLQTTITADGVTVDMSGPVAGTVNDGAGTDIDVQVSTTTVTANWSGFSDPGSGISGYEWAIGTTPGGTDVQNWTGAGSSTLASNWGLSITPGATCYVSVRATNGTGATVTATSDGVLVNPAAAVPRMTLLIGDNAGNVALVDSQSRTVRASRNLNSTGIAHFDVFDVDQDGVNEILATHVEATTFPATCMEAVGLGTKWQTNQNASLRLWGEMFGNRAWMADVDQDGAAELVLPHVGTGSNATTIRVYTAATGALEFTLPGTVNNTPTLFLDPVDGRYKLTADWSPSAFSHYLRCFDLKDNLQLWENSSVNTHLPSAVGSSMIDGQPRLWGGWYSGTLYVTNRSGTLQWSRSLGWTYEAKAMYAGDLRGDGVEALVVGGSNSGPARVSALRLSDGNTLWDNSDATGYWDATVLLIEDVNADGAKEVLIRQGHYGPPVYPKYRLLRGSDGTVLWERAYPSSVNLSFIARRADVNGDGQKEFLVGVDNRVEALDALTGTVLETYSIGAANVNTFEVTPLNGIADATAPVAGTVNDGAGADINYQTSTTTITANWSGFGDPQSGLTGYEWAIGTTPGGTDVQGWTNVGGATSATNSSLALAGGAVYYVSVRGTNGAGFQATATSDGVTVDTTPPPTVTINDGTGGDSDSQTSTTTISANWGAFADPESGITLYSWAIGTSPGATDVQGWTGVGTATSGTNSGLSLTVGATYYVSVQGTNGVGMQNTVYTDGVTITTTNNPPTAIPGASLAQFQEDGTTPIGVGGATTSPNVVLRAVCSDPDAGDAVSLQVEVRPVGEPLTGMPTHTSASLPNGSTISIPVGPNTTVNQAFHWQARVVDNQNAVGPWTAFGGNSDLAYPADPDFVIGAPPNVPPSMSGPAQRTTGGAAIPVGGALPPANTGFVVEATVSDPDAGQEILMEVEIKPIDTPFGGAATHRGGPAASGSVVQVPVTGLQKGGHHWQCRAVDSFGLSGPWVPFGGNAETAADVVAGAGPSFTMPEGALAPALVLFDSPEYPGVTLYEWDFDYDGTAFTADYSSPSSGDCSYRYAEWRSQPYQARLGVTTAAGTEYFDLYVTVERPPEPPTVTVIPTATQGQVPLTVNFTATVTGFGVINSIEWDFNGDGSVDFVAINNQFTATYEYLLPGTFTCRVKATDSAGAADVDEMTIVARPGPDAPTISGLTPLPPAVNPGDTVEFVCTADPGSSGDIVRFEWDFDGNGDADLTHVVSPVVTGPVTSTVTHVFDKAGLYPCRVVVVDSDNMAAVASTEVTVNAPPALRVWWSQPKDGDSVRGDAVTLHANTAPGNLTAKVEFYYRSNTGASQPPMTDPSWIRIGESVPPPYSFFSVAWDTTGLASGAYDLLAVATDTSGTRVSSQAKGNVTVLVSPTAVVQDEANHVTTVNATSDASAVVAGQIDLEIENGGVVDAAGQVPERTTVTIAPPADDAALNHATAQNLTLPRRYYTRISLEPGQALQKPGRLTMYYRDDNNDGIEDFSKVPAEQLKGFRFDKTDNRWEPLLDVTVDKKEKRIYMRTPAFSDFALGGVTFAAGPGEGGLGKCFGSASAECEDPWHWPLGLLCLLVILASLRIVRGNRG